MPGAPHILVRSPNWLGDAIMSTAALQRLRAARPESHITVLTAEKLAGLWEGQPFLDEVMTFAPSETLWQLSRRLRQKKFSSSVAFPNSIRSALELWLARIPQRIGYKKFGRCPFLTHAIARRPEAVPMRKRSDEEIRRLIAENAPPTIYPAAAHHVQDYLLLTSILGASREPLPPKIVVASRPGLEFCDRFNLPAPAPERPWFGLNPGAEYGPAKRWPASRFIEVALTLQKETQCRWVVFGGHRDRALATGLATEIQNACGENAALNLAGRTTLRELASLLSLCRVVLTNDTGPMHLAAAVGAPVVVLFGSTSPELTGPIFSACSQVVRKAPPCAPCFRRECPIDLRCLNNIETAQVLEAVRRAACLSGGAAG